MTDTFRALCAELLDELDFQTSHHEIKDLKARARTALAEGAGVPRPIPVAERLPTAADCDAEGRVWLLTPADELTSGDHWLPADVIPLPEASP
jgi:hypothetical protein